jgi:hypothetical protein
MERQWRAPGVAQGANLCVWREGGKIGKIGLWSSRGAARLPIPDWVRANFKRNCPRNYKALVESYGTEKYRE